MDAIQSHKDKSQHPKEHAQYTTSKLSSGPNSCALT